MKYILTGLLLAACYFGHAQAYTPDGEKTVLPKLVFDDKGELVIKASATSSQHDFDYLVGKWKLAHHKLRSRLINCKEWD